MILSTETLTALSALSGRIIAPLVPHPGSSTMAAIFNDLSPVERGTLYRILESERHGRGVQLEQKQITALSLIQERLYQKDQMGAFVPTELKALAECTGRQWPSSANNKMSQSVNAATNDTNTKESDEADESDDIVWNNPNDWFRTG